MKKFKTGKWVEITSHRDRSWNYWNSKHDRMKGKAAEIIRVEKSKDGKHTFYYLRDLDGFGGWFLDRHMILTPKQDRRFIDHMRKSCKQLQEHEKLCKRLRDEMLQDIFVEKQEEEELFGEEFWDDDDPGLADDLEDDWENVITKPMVPLPGKGKKKIRIRKTSKRTSRNKKQAKTNTKQNAQSDDSIDTSNMDPADWMTEDELEEYLDSVYGIDWI